jgi:hypothetical protein
MDRPSIAEHERQFMTKFRLRRFLSASFAAMTLLLSTSATLGQGATPASATQGAVPVSMTECEGINDCATWTFLGKQGNGQWPSGEMANLAVESLDGDKVVIQRADSTGASAGLTATYTGTRHGNRVGGEFTSSWPGHWTKKEGDWYATIDRQSAIRPEVMHFCGLGCDTLRLRGDHYVGDTGGIWTIVSFTPESVILNRVDPNGWTGFFKGQISSDGNHLVNTVMGFHPYTPDSASDGNTPHNTFNITWGNALNSIPGSGPAPGHPVYPQSPTVVAVCVPWFFTIVCR